MGDGVWSPADPRAFGPTLHFKRRALSSPRTTVALGRPAAAILAPIVADNRSNARPRSRPELMAAAFGKPP